MQYLMMPLDAHYDSGFGAMASAFREAAKILREAQPTTAFFQHPPQTYLYRHAIELFLKAEIIILHRKFKLPFGTEPHDGQPMVREEGKWKPMYRIHSIRSLYSHWWELIDPRLTELKEMTKYKVEWDVLEGADKWVDTIENIDPASTYSRYPSVRDVNEDRAKSPFKETAEDKICPKGEPPDRAVMALVVENQDHEFVRAYVSDKSEVQDQRYLVALEELTEMLFNYHAMMRFELTGGV